MDYINILLLYRNDSLRARCLTKISLFDQTLFQTIQKIEVNNNEILLLLLLTIHYIVINLAI
jgi:hypothetical protein